MTTKFTCLARRMKLPLTAGAQRSGTKPGLAQEKHVPTANFNKRLTKRKYCYDKHKLNRQKLQDCNLPAIVCNNSLYYRLFLTVPGILTVCASVTLFASNALSYPVYTTQPVDNRVEPTDCSFNRLSNRVVQPVWQPAVYTIQPFVKPCVKGVWQPVECLYTRYNRLSKRFDNRFDNRLYRVNGASQYVYRLLLFLLA